MTTKRRGPLWRARSGVKRTAGSVTLRFLVTGLALFSLTGCAGFGRGLGEAVMARTESAEDTRACHVKGHAFLGLEHHLERQALALEEGGPKSVLKVLMVHGIGSHQPGFGTRLAENLARLMELDVSNEELHQFELASSEWPDQTLGTLRVSRYSDRHTTREMFFYELTWDPIVQAEKDTIAYDGSGEYSFRRAEVNNMMKNFVNDTVPDVMTYQGTSRSTIQTSAGQAICWMTTKRWDEIPTRGVHECNPSQEGLSLIERDDFVFMSHSLGSRIVLDSFERLARIVHADDSVWDDRLAAAFAEKEFQFFMLSNQLPLLQLGRERPEVYGRIDDYCSAEGALRARRWAAHTNVVAFSDPNDVMSYAIPPRFLEKYVDSRLCPSATNVIINVAHVRNLFGLGQVANPLGAHTQYDNDDRVIRLIVGGLGDETEDPVVADRCTWMQLR